MKVAANITQKMAFPAKWNTVHTAIASAIAGAKASQAQPALPITRLAI